MNSRERVLCTLNHREPDRVPVCLAYEDPEDLVKRYGKNPDVLNIMRQDVYQVSMNEPPMPTGFKERYLKDIPAGATISPWGFATWFSPTGESHAVRGALQNMKTIKELEGYAFPDMGSDACAAGLAEKVERLHQKGVSVQGSMSQTIFELAWYLYGMEDLMIAFYENSDFVHYLLDKITEQRKAMARQFIEARVDILRLGDDVGSQRGMLMNPDIWRTFLKPRLASIISVARASRPDMPIFYHSDGDIRDIIEDLIEAGVTILNPVQPECMDPVGIKKRYGTRLTLWGTIGTQTVFPFGTPAEIRRLVKHYVEELAPGGGYVIGPTHSIQRDVPWENIAAFYEAVECYGVYGGNGT